jgi:hypothetical protein
MVHLHFARRLVSMTSITADDAMAAALVGLKFASEKRIERDGAAESPVALGSPLFPSSQFSVYRCVCTTTGPLALPYARYCASAPPGAPAAARCGDENGMNFRRAI